MSILRHDKDGNSSAQAASEAPTARIAPASPAPFGPATADAPSSSPPARAAPVAGATESVPAAPGSLRAHAPEIQGTLDLRRRRDALAQEVTELHWDLGGLAYEMAIRDHFRLDVLIRRAAILQERDAELAELERLLRLEETASAGSCPHCSAPHSRGALFCWQCGATLMERSPSAALGGDGDSIEDSTAIMDAMLAPRAAAPPEPADHSDE